MTSSNTNNNANGLDNTGKSSTNNSKLSVDDSMFLDTELIHQGITDDDLDLLLSSGIKSQNNPPKNLFPAEFAADELDSEVLDKELHHETIIENELLEVDDLVAVDIDNSELSIVEDDLLDLDEIDAVLDNNYGFDASATELTLLDENDVVLNKAEEPNPIVDEAVNLELVESKTDSEATLIDLITPLPDNKPKGFVESESEIFAAPLDQSDKASQTDDLEPTKLVSDSVQSNQLGDTNVSVSDNGSSEKSNIEVSLEIQELSEENNESKTIDIDKNAVGIEIQTLTNGSTSISNPVVGTELKFTTSDPKESEVDKSVMQSEDVPISNLSVGNAIADDEVVPSKQNVSFAIPKPIIPATFVASSIEEVTLNKNEGKTTMTDNVQANIIEKVQVDIDELKRKLHSMNSDFYNAATDSAALIGLVRELETTSSNDFAGTYSQSRELRRILVEARKIFNQLASGIDMLEESLETDLFEVQRKN